jgi:hypothetical protein
MRPAEFEEKDFEGPLYNQLLSGSSNFATPGQVFEGNFGIDAALEVLHCTFWNYFGYPAPIRGVVLNNIPWGFIWPRLGRRGVLPNFSVNALIQAKRPDRLEGRRSAFSSFGITGRYWRFFVTPHQQQLLERLSGILANQALVVYASPAFDTLDELYTLTTSRQVVDRSSFVKASRMAGHNAWNYNTPGTRGVAESAPEPIEDKAFHDQVNGMLERYNRDANPREELANLHAVLVTTCKEISDGNPLARFFLNRHSQMQEFITRTAPKDPELIEHFLGTIFFCDSANVAWLSAAPG